MQRAKLGWKTMLAGAVFAVANLALTLPGVIRGGGDVVGVVVSVLLLITSLIAARRIYREDS